MTKRTFRGLGRCESIHDIADVARVLQRLLVLNGIPALTNFDAIELARGVIEAALRRAIDQQEAKR